MRREFGFFAALAAVVLAALLAAPAVADKQPPTETVDLSLSSTCADGGSVTFSWSGFGGAKSVAVFAFDATDPNNPILLFDETATTHGPSGTYGPVTFAEHNGQTYTAAGVVTYKHDLSQRTEVSQTASCS
jgi:hypothetical protein